MNITTETNDAASIMVNVVMKGGLSCKDSKYGVKPNMLDICTNQKSNKESNIDKTRRSTTKFDDDNDDDDDYDDGKQKDITAQKHVHFDQIDWKKEEEKHWRGHDTRQERLKSRQQKKRRRQRSKILMDKKKRLLRRRHEEHLRLNETLLYILLCDVNLLVCQYQKEALKNIFDDIFTSAETPGTRFPCVRFLVLRSRLKEIVKRSTKFISSQVKEALLRYHRSSPVFASSLKEMNSFHALCHLRNINLSFLFVGEDGDSDRRTLISFIHEFIDECMGSLEVNQKSTETFLFDCDCDYETDRCHFCGGTLCYDVDFSTVAYDGISREAKSILFLMSTLPAFLNLTKTNEIRHREVMLLISM